MKIFYYVCTEQPNKEQGATAYALPLRDRMLVEITKITENNLD